MKIVSMNIDRDDSLCEVIVDMNLKHVRKLLTYNEIVTGFDYTDDGVLFNLDFSMLIDRDHYDNDEDYDSDIIKMINYTLEKAA